MFEKTVFLIFSTLRNLRYGKVMVSFTVMSYAIGWLLPASILSASYQEIMQMKSMGMKDADRIIRVEDEAQMLPAIPGKEERKTSERDLLNRLKNLDPAVESVTYKSEYSGILTDGEKYRYVNIVYVDASFDQYFDHLITEGRWFHPSGKGECILGTALSRQLWRDSGLDKEIRINGTKYVVIGETETYDNRVILRDEGQEEIKGMTQYFIRLKESESVDYIMEKIRSLGGDMQVDRMIEINQRNLKQAYAGLFLLFLLSLIVLLYALMNIGNIIGLWIQERRRKYGIQLALGAKKKDLYLEFYLELLFITSISLVLVFTLLFLGEPWIERYLFPIRIDALVILVITGFNIGLCALLGMIFMKQILRSNIVGLIRGSDG